MKRFKKLSVAIVVLAMCALLGISVWAANTSDVTYTATFYKPTLCITGEEQTVTLTVKVSAKVDMDSFTADVKLPEGFKLTAITCSTLDNETEDDYLVNLDAGRIMWFSSSTDDVENDLLAEVTFEVPTDVATGEYKIDFEILDISSNYGDVWEDGETLTATLTVAEHEWKAPTYSDKEGDTHTANYVCANDASHTKSVERVPHDFTNGDCVCGAKKPVTDISVIYKGDALANAYTVEGSVVTVTHTVACKVGYWDETEGKYIALTATPVEGNTYSFTAPEGVTEVLLVVKGDANGDGSVTMADANRARAQYNSKLSTPMTAEQLFAANVNTDDSITMSDANSIRAAYNNKKALTW